MASNHCRKRGRADDSDCEECMPISKRINRLQIRPSVEGTWNGGEEQDGDAALNNNLQIGPSQCCQTGAAAWPQCNGSLHNSYNLNHWHPGEGTSQNFIPQPSAANPNGEHHRGGDVNDLGVAPGFVDPSHCINGQVSPGIGHLAGALLGQNEQPLQLVDMSAYEPELKSGDNPNYYEANRVLFEAHKTRITRELGSKDPP